MLWANLHLLFWLSLVPFLTGWMSENDFPPVPTATYGMVLLAAAVAYYVLQTALLRASGPDSLLAAAVGRDVKGKVSPLLYCLGIGLSFVERWLGIAVYVAGGADVAGARPAGRAGGRQPAAGRGLTPAPARPRSAVVAQRRSVREARPGRPGR